MLACVFAITWFTSTAMAVHLPGILQHVGLTLTMAVGLAALVGPSQVAARVMEFALLRNKHPLYVARVAALAHPVGATLLLLMGAPAALLFCVFHGLGNGIMTIAIGTLPLLLFGASGYGFRQGMLLVPSRLMQAAAPLLFGLMIEKWDAGALLVSTTLGVIACALLVCIRPSSEKA